MFSHINFLLNIECQSSSQANQTDQCVSIKVSQRTKTSGIGALFPDAVQGLGQI